MKTAAIIPAFNESDRVRSVLERTRPFVDHIILVDDGSKKELSLLLVSHPQVTILRHRINLGKGAALKTAALWARTHAFDAVVLLDADGQHRPEEIPRLLEPLQLKQAMIVLGTRQFHNDMPVVARAGNRLLSFSLRFFFGISVADTQSGFRAFRLSILDQLLWESPRYAVETEMLVNVGKRHILYSEVPISTIYLDRYKGTTIFDGLRIFLNMITWRFL